MQLSTTFRHMEASSAVREYAEEKLEKIRKYFHRQPIGAHAVFCVERNHSHSAELSITLPNGLVLQAREITEDMYSSIDLAVARIERQVRKWKDKIRDHKPHGEPGFSVREVVLPAESLEPPPRPSVGAQETVGEEVRPPSPPPPPAITVIKESTFTVRVMRVED